MRALARVKKASVSRVIAELVESGLQAPEAERDRFLELADRLARSHDRAEQERLKGEQRALGWHHRGLQGWAMASAVEAVRKSLRSNGGRMRRF